MASRASWTALQRVFETALREGCGAARPFARADVPVSCGADDGPSLVQLLAAHARRGAVDGLAEAIGRQARHVDRPAVPTLGARWRIVAPLACGGRALVYRAVGTRTSVSGAVKVLKGNVVDPGLCRRFDAERRLLLRLAHPDIPLLLDDGIAVDGRPWLALEYVKGLSLYDWCKAARPGLDERLTVFCRLCATVEHAHERGVVHGDLTPSNVLVGARLRTTLIDFGSGRYAGDPACASGPRPTAFTPGFASPEHLRGEAISPASDVFQLGVLLRWLIDGQRARVSHAGGHRQASSAPRSRPRARTGLDADLRAIAAGATHLDRRARYQTARELRLALGDWRTGRARDDAWQRPCRADEKRNRGMPAPE